jgi:2-dehydro-3-deoxyglucarate aldolase/4-hydroxy-2-oxoheptanedioate aldolase
MSTLSSFQEKISQGQACLGTAITLSDPTVTEALTNVLDFVWIDMEHTPMSLETVQSHVMATRGTKTTPLVRVAWNDPVLMKPVLDLGAAGIIVPLVRTVADVERAVAACRYPPEGIRGFGPRRASNYGRESGPEFCRQANESVMTIVQIEHVDALENLDEILSVAGLTSVVVGPNDLAGSLGHMGDTGHPAVKQAIETVISKAQDRGVPMGLAIGGEVEDLTRWIDRGVCWLAISADFRFLLQSVTQLAEGVRGHRQS